MIYGYRPTERERVRANVNDRMSTWAFVMALMAVSGWAWYWALAFTTVIYFTLYFVGYVLPRK